MATSKVKLDVDAKPAGRVFDVAKPGKSAPSASAKPIIISHHPMMQDPMVKPDGGDEEASGPVLAHAPTRVVIKPLTDDLEQQIAAAAEAAAKPTKAAPEASAEPAEQAEAATKVDEATTPTDNEKATSETGAEPVEASATATEPAPEPAEETPEPAAPAADDEAPAEEPTKVADKTTEPASQPQSDAETPATTPDTDASTSNGTDPATGKPASDATNEKAAAEAAEREAARKKELEQLAESHKYYLPINQVEKRRNKRWALVGLLVIILLALAWADVALDAGLISIPGVHAVTHFFGS